MFSLFSRKRVDCKEAPVYSLTGDSLPPLTHHCPSDPREQVELICETLQKLAQVRQMVEQLPEIPLGDRQDLLAQLACTTDNLRSLYFLDAIY